MQLRCPSCHPPTNCITDAVIVITRNSTPPVLEGVLSLPYATIPRHSWSILASARKYAEGTDRHMSSISSQPCNMISVIMQSSCGAPVLVVLVIPTQPTCDALQLVIMYNQQLRGSAVNRDTSQGEHNMSYCICVMYMLEWLLWDLPFRCGQRITLNSRLSFMLIRATTGGSPHRIVILLSM